MPQVFHKNRRWVEEWNAAPGPRHRVALNRFADWAEEEYMAVVAPGTK